jgi:hypothetical protein
MKVIDHKVGMTREELDAIIASKRFHVREHTPYYMNGITAQCADISLGFYNWLEGMDCFIGSDDSGIRIPIQDSAHLELILAAMDALMAVENYGKK